MSVISPKVRRSARERAMQFLFGLDFTAYPWEESLELYWENRPARPSVRDYAETLVRGVMDRRDELDMIIDGALDRWTPERIGRIERNILRVATYEMRHGDNVPSSVAINEAVEIAKAYGADESPAFINAVLDRVKDL